MKTTPTRHLVIILIAVSLGLTARADIGGALASAKAALAQNDLKTAEEILGPLATGENAHAGACHELGAVRQRQGRFEEAIANYERATQLEPTNARHFAALGMAIGQRMSQMPMMEQGMLAMSLRKAFAKAVELDPNNVTGLIGLTRFYVNAPEFAGGSIVRAKEFAERVKKLVPVLGEIELAGIAEREEDFASAARHYEAAAKLDPTHLHARMSAARALIRIGRNAAAREQLEAALKLNPNYEPAKQTLAQLDATSQ